MMRLLTSAVVVLFLGCSTAVAEESVPLGDVPLIGIQDLHAERLEYTLIPCMEEIQRLYPISKIWYGIPVTPVAMAMAHMATEDCEVDNDLARAFSMLQYADFPMREKVYAIAREACVENNVAEMKRIYGE